MGNILNNSEREKKKEDHKEDHKDDHKAKSDQEGDQKTLLSPEENKAFVVRLETESERLDGLLAELQRDPSLSCMLNVFNQLLVNPNYESLSKIIDAMCNEAKEMFKIAPSLQEHAGQEKINELFALLNSFSQLLTDTKKAVTLSNEQAKIQETNTIDMITKINNWETDHKDGKPFDKDELTDIIDILAHL